MNCAAIFGMNACVLHPFDLADADPDCTDVHGGKSETSVMLALAPDLVRRDLIGKGGPSDPQALRTLVYDRGTAWPWRTDDPRIARDGIVGDASEASAEFGTALIERMLAAAGGTFAKLLENQKLMRARQ
jgi:creatinine amidohydrolase